MVAVGESAVTKSAANLEQRRASDPSASAWVSANAGSGKTHVLVDRLVRLMLAGSKPSCILCLTFTKAAAAEMATRLFQRLSEWISLDDRQLTEQLAAIGVAGVDAPMRLGARRLFTQALETPGGLKIQTIHAFCERLLQLFPVEAGIVPRFQVMDDRASAEVLENATIEVMTAALADPGLDLGLALAEVTRHVHADAFDELLRALIGARADIAPYTGGPDGVRRAEAALRLVLGLAQGEDETSIRNSLPLDPAAYKRLAAALATGSAADKIRAAGLAAAATATASLFDLRKFYLRADDRPRAAGGIAASKQLKTGNPWIETFIADEQRRLHEALGKLADLTHLRATVALLVLAGAVLEAFEREKRRRGVYDFDDLILRTSRLLGERPDAAWVLYKLDGGIEHVLLDEAQDTNPAQWSILAALTEEFFAGAGRQGELRTLFVVGDRKQSIYSFQGADPDYFESMHEGFSTRAQGAGQRFEDVDFKVSFRSAPEVLQAVDAVFAEGSPARHGLLGKAGHDFLHQSNRLGAEGLVELWPVVEPDEADEHQPWQFPVDREPANAPHRKLARQIAAKIGSWIGKRRLAGAKRAVEASDILILVRTRNALFDALVRELRQAGVPVAGADRLKLGGSLAVQDVLALARVCLLEADDYSLACVLKSPLMESPFSEDRLFALAHGRGTSTLWRRLMTAAEPHAAAAATELRAWRQSATTLRPYEFLAAVIAASRRRSLARLGSEASDALDSLLDQAIAYESEHPSSLQGFLAWFAASDIEIKRNMEPGAGEVRIMTVHGAKGLEAPIVILPDTVSMPDDRNAAPLRFIEVGAGGHKLPLWQVPKSYNSETLQAVKSRLGDARLFEYRRLLYVAMTRARDELYIGGYRGRNEVKDECWYRAIAGALAPHLGAAGEPGVLRLGSVPQALPTAPSEPPQALALPSWLGASPGPATAPPRRTAPSKLAAGEAGAAAAIERGLFIHRALQLMPDVAAADRPALLSRLAVRAGQPPDVAALLSRVVSRPDIAALLGDDGVSEVPILATLPDGTTLTGRIDRLIVRPSEILVVDYKTDRVVPAAPEDIAMGYLAQLAAYAAALRLIHPGYPVRCAILWTAAPRLMDIPDLVLKQALDRYTVGRT